MANSSKSSKKIMNMVYGLGASVVIIGALFKILHWEIALGSIKLGGGTLLAIGLITEAIIFAISAFEPVDAGYDWSRVFPELEGGEPRQLNFSGNAQLPARNDQETQIEILLIFESLDHF